MTTKKIAPPLSHDEAIKALCDCAATVTVLSYQEAVEGYFSLRGLPIPSAPALTTPTRIEAAQPQKAVDNGGKSLQDHPCYGLPLNPTGLAHRNSWPLSTEDHPYCSRCGTEIEGPNNQQKDGAPLCWEPRPSPTSTPPQAAESGPVETAVAKIGRWIDSGEISSGETAPVNGKRYVVMEYDNYKHDLEMREERGRKKGQAAAESGLLDEALEALKPFANVAEQIRAASKDNRWLEQVLFYMGTDDDPSKWSLTGRAFDRARALLAKAGKQGEVGHG